jgi:hypothetical protein
MLFQNVTGDAVRLREMILSIPQHMSNSHQFPENSSFKECSHLQLPQTGRDKKWLKPDSMVSNFVDPQRLFNSVGIQEKILSTVLSYVFF